MSLSLDYYTIEKINFPEEKLNIHCSILKDPFPKGTIDFYNEKGYFIILNLLNNEEFLNIILLEVFKKTMTETDDEKMSVIGMIDVQECNFPNISCYNLNGNLVEIKNNQTLVYDVKKINTIEYVELPIGNLNFDSSKGSLFKSSKTKFYK